MALNMSVLPHEYWEGMVVNSDGSITYPDVPDYEKLRNNPDPALAEKRKRWKREADKVRQKLREQGLL